MWNHALQNTPGPKTIARNPNNTGAVGNHQTTPTAPMAITTATTWVVMYSRSEYCADAKRRAHRGNPGHSSATCKATPSGNNTRTWTSERWLGKPMTDY